MALSRGPPPILSLLELEASDKKLWKSITHSTKGLLADLLPPSETRLSNRGHSYVLPFKLGLNVLNAVLVTGVFSALSNSQLYSGTFVCMLVIPWGRGVIEKANWDLRSTLISIRQTDVDRLMIRTQSRG